MNLIDCIKKKIESHIAQSSVPEDPLHSKNTREWLLKLQPAADDSLQIAALGHDIDRAMNSKKVKRSDFDNYDDFKAAHARNSARILKEIMQECGMTDDTFIQEVINLITHHETGGDPRSDLLKEADSISFFEVNLPLYYERNSREETKRRCLWGFKRLPSRTKIIAGNFTFEKDELNQLLKEVVEESSS